MSRDTFYQTRLLKAPSSLAWNTAREGAATASRGNLCQGLTTLRVKNLFLISNLNIPFFSLKTLLLVLYIEYSKTENVWTFPEKGDGFSRYTLCSAGRNVKTYFAWDLLITNFEYLIIDICSSGNQIYFYDIFANMISRPHLDRLLPQMKEG